MTANSAGHAVGVRGSLRYNGLLSSASETRPTLRPSFFVMGIHAGSTIMSATRDAYDLKQTLTDNRLVGIWRMMTGFRLTYLVAALSLGVAAIARTGNYLLLRTFVDNILAEGSRSGMLPLVALGFVGLALVQGAFTFLSGRLAAQTAEGIVLRLRNYLYDHIQRLSFTYHDGTPTGELIQRSTSDVDALRRFFADQAIGCWTHRPPVHRQPGGAPVPELEVGPALCRGGADPRRDVHISSSNGSKPTRRFRNRMPSSRRRLQENLSGVRVVKAFARQAYERDKFEADNWEKFLRGRRLLTMHSLYWPVSDILCGFQMLGGFIVGALMAINGTITIGTYLAYAGMVIWIIWPDAQPGPTHCSNVHRPGLLWAGEQDHRRGTGTAHEGDRPPDCVQGEIVFDQVGFRYEPNQPACLQEISFPCQPGQVVALLGSTGSGKTTLVNLLPRFYDYTSGSLTLDGMELQDYPRGFLRQQIGIVEQEPFLFSRTIRDNITYGVSRQVSDEEVEAAARAAAIHDTHPQPSPMGTTPWWAKRASRCPAVRSSVWPSPARLLKRPVHPDPRRLDLLGGHRDGSARSVLHLDL